MNCFETEKHKFKEKFDNVALRVWDGETKKCEAFMREEQINVFCMWRLNETISFEHVNFSIHISWSNLNIEFDVGL